MVPSMKEQFKDDYLLSLYEALPRMSGKSTAFWQYRAR
jgi:hypothetical protein